MLQLLHNAPQIFWSLNCLQRTPLGWKIKRVHLCSQLEALISFYLFNIVGTHSSPDMKHTAVPSFRDGTLIAALLPVTYMAACL